MRKQNKNAFTLVEIMTVVIILGIAAAAIVPQLGTRDDLNVSAAARVLMADLAYAQNRSIATQKKHYVEFNGSTYTVLARDTDASPLYTLTHPLTLSNYITTIGATNSTTANISIATVNLDGTANHAIQFDSLGSPSSYNPITDTATALIGTGTLTLQTSSGSFSTNVLIDPSTGEASIQ